MSSSRMTGRSTTASGASCRRASSVRTTSTRCPTGSAPTTSPTSSLDQIQSGFKTIDWEAYNASSKIFLDYYGSSSASRPADAQDVARPPRRRASRSIPAPRPIVVSERLSMPMFGVAPELRRRERNTRLIGVALLVPAAALALLFLYYPLLFIFQMSFTEGELVSVAGGSGPDDRQLRPHPRTLPAEPVRDDPAGLLATLVDLVLGFPFAYILVRRVRYRDVVRALMVFPMFGRCTLRSGSARSCCRWPARPVLRGARGLGHVAAVQPAIGRVRDGDLHLPVHGHEHRGAVERRPDPRGGRVPRGAVRNVPPGRCWPGRASSRARSRSSAGASARSRSRRCSAASRSSARSR